MPSLSAAKGSTSPTAGASQKKYGAFNKAFVGSGRPNDGTFSTRTPSATPGRPYGTFTKSLSSFARPDDGRFSDRAPGATPQRLYGAFTGKTLSATDGRFVTDTYRLVMTMDPVDAVSVEMTDTYTVVLTMTATSSVASFARTDTYTPVLTMTYGLTKSGNVNKAATDTYTPVLTMAPLKSVLSLLTDTYTPVMTMDSVTEKAPLGDFTDTYTVVFDMDADVASLSGVLTWPRDDNYVPVWTMTARATVAGDVDHIRITTRPCGRIRITPV